MTNGSFISTSIKTGIVLQLMTTNNKKKTKGNNIREDFSKLFCIMNISQVCV